MRAFYSDHFVLPLPEGHKFPMTKYARLRERVIAEGIVPPERLTEAPPASWDDLRLVHTADYVEAVAAGTLPSDVQRRIGFPWSPGMGERSRRSVGATIAAARAALADGLGVNLAGGTHHAFADRGEGYCVFNDVAVGARVLQRDHGISRIAIVDCDVHLDDGIGDAEYLSLLAEHVHAVLEHHAPDFVFYLAGADPYEGDRLGRLRLTIEGLRTRDELVLGRCRAFDLPVAISMSGGYALDIEAIVTIHANTIAVAAGLATALTPDP